jgi:hypothetical protein
MVDHNAIQKSLTEENHFYIFYTKVDEPVKAVIGQFPGNLSVEDIIVALQEIRVYFVISMKQMTTNIPFQKEGSHTPPSPFPNSASKESRVPELFKSATPCNTFIKVEAYRSHGLTQCYNFQCFEHSWVHCRQPPCWLWY